VTEPARPLIAVRVVRPFETEAQFFEFELETLGRTSIILVGAHSRPAGVVLRFELALASGEVLVRGEGRVLTYKERAFRGQPGLALRFTRLDPKSKAFVDRAAQLREARMAHDEATSGGPSPSLGLLQAQAAAEPADPVAVSASVPPPAPSVVSEPDPASPAFSPALAPTLGDEPLPETRATHSLPDAPPTTEATPSPARRAELLERLRQRARVLPEKDKNELSTRSP
jgi:hypothetical protein